MNPNTPTPPPPKPIQDVAPPGNTPQFAPIPMHQAPDDHATAVNPISAAAPPPTSEPAANPQTPVKNSKATSKDLKASPQKAPKSSKSIVAISVAVLAALVLSGAAYFAFKPN